MFEASKHGFDASDLDCVDRGFSDRMQYVQQLCASVPSVDGTQAARTRRWIDLVYPRDTSCPGQATCGWINEMQRPTLKQRQLKCLENSAEPLIRPERISNRRRQASAQHCPQTFLVDETGEWRKKRHTCLCKQHDCPGALQQKGAAYMVARVQRMSTGMERFWDVKSGLELRLGIPAKNAKNGFQVAASACAALRMHSRTPLCGREMDIIVLRGVCSGLGCMQGECLWVPVFRPVHAVEYVVTRY
jgi:hypothetical protein